MREKKQHCIEVHVAGICFRETDSQIEVLIAKRQNNRALFPGKWECGGGQVDAGENFEEAVKRQMREELGVSVRGVLPFGTYEIPFSDSLQQKIPGVKFVCFWDGYQDGKGPKIDQEEFSEWRWQSINDLEELDFISGIPQDIHRGWEFYTNNKSAFSE